MASQTARFFFSRLDYAAEALLTTLEDMRESQTFYSIQGLSAQSILESGLVLTGELDSVIPKLQKIPTATMYQ